MSDTTRFAECLHQSKTTALGFLAWRPRRPSIWTVRSTHATANASPREARSRTTQAWLQRRPEDARG